jgi:ATP-dependent helicase/nuclease subunit A
VDALAAEHIARQREELNALYVAMTRARSRLVLSSTQPHRAAPASWWQRLLALAEPLAAPAQAVATATPDAQPATFVMQQLPPAPVQAAALPLPVEEDDDTPTARLGQAMHRLLEWWVPGAESGAGGWSAQQRLSVQREFALGTEQINEAAAMAQRILTGDGAWAWDRTVVDWQGNEVVIHHAGEALRLDRLVHRRDTGEWWVLDHKSEWRPELKPGLQDKMNNYRAAVEAAYPQAVVRAAYLTAQGKLVNV